MQVSKLEARSMMLETTNLRKSYLPLSRKSRASSRSTSAT